MVGTGYKVSKKHSYSKLTQRLSFRMLKESVRHKGRWAGVWPYSPVFNHMPGLVVKRRLVKPPFHWRATFQSLNEINK